MHANVKRTNDNGKGSQLIFESQMLHIYFRHYVQISLCQVQEKDIPPLIDVPQSIHQEEINLLTETDRLGKSCKKRPQIFM